MLRGMTIMLHDMLPFRRRLVDEDASREIDVMRCVEIGSAEVKVKQGELGGGNGGNGCL